VSWPQYVALGSRGGRLVLVGNGGSGMGPPQLMVNDNPDGGFSAPVSLGTARQLSAGAWANLEDLGAAGQVLSFIDFSVMANAVRLTSTDGTTWIEPQNPVPPLIDELRTVTVAEGAALRTTFVARTLSNVTGYFETDAGTVTTPLGTSLEQFDLAAIGDHYLLTGVAFGVVHLGVMSADGGAPVEFGAAGFGPGSHPTVTVAPDGTIGLAWEEQQADGGWRMAGRLIR
jgi:hypothetical protein